MFFVLELCCEGAELIDSVLDVVRKEAEGSRRALALERCLPTLAFGSNNVLVTVSTSDELRRICARIQNFTGISLRALKLRLSTDSFNTRPYP